jgi:exopolysaccharide biosynthesis polyprenyl glycosylphosphotransferase
VTDVVEAARINGDTVRPVAPEPDLTRRTARRPSDRGNRSLLLRLLLIDFFTVLGAWLVVFPADNAYRGLPIWTGWVSSIPLAVVLASLTIVLMWTQRLYQSRVCIVRSNEMNRLFRVAVAIALIASVWHKFVNQASLTPFRATVGAASAMVALACSRSLYSGWLRLRRAGGDFARQVCVIGTNDEAEALVHLLNDHPELGYQVKAVVGDPDEWDARIPGVDVIRAGSDLAADVVAAGVTGVLIATTALNDTDRERLLSRLMTSGLHVQISAGLTRVGRNRIRMMPLAHYPAFYLEPRSFSVSQAMLKRAVDVGVAGMGLILASPVLLLSGLAIKLQDGGPVFYRQDRVGLNRRIFGLIKLRTMVPDAAQRLGEVEERNERKGPLFKLADDPRVTKVGKFLRASSIDEIPQLLNVLRGEMSVVGPRPALPAEFAQFDDDLVERALVPPGITGLWQVEARDNPSFRAYRRLDLFYVDNWSIGFDVAIMVGTARMLIATTLGALGAAFLKRLRRQGPIHLELGNSDVAA